MKNMVAWLTALALVLVVLLSFGSPAQAAPEGSAALPAPVPCPNCWHPALNTSWQWQLQGKIDQSYNVTMYDIDMFDNTASVVTSLHNAGAHRHLLYRCRYVGELAARRQ